ncbi:MAG: transglutaminase domain-containing protein [Lachnospiraceae bacterium]|nr:transglutaminase domain-containing protein [Lachnospiraceae bacterium]
MKKNKKLKIACICAVGAVVIGVLIYFLVNSVYYMGLHKKINVELGESLPKAVQFLKGDGEVKYITDISKIDKNKTGKYQVKIEYNGKEKNVYIEIKDTTPPLVEVRDMDISVYDTLTVKDLIVKVSDASKVKMEFKEEPQFGKVGRNNVVIVVKDESGNITEATATVDVLKVKDYVEYRYGEALPQAKDFIFSDKDSGKLKSDLADMINKPGTYYVDIEIDGKNYKSKLIVIDENPPTVVGCDAEISKADIQNGEPISPDQFVLKYYDEDDVTIYFVDKPNYIGKEETLVSVAVSDTSGNTTIIERKLYVVDYKGFNVELGSGAVDGKVIADKLGASSAKLVSGKVDTNKLGRYSIAVEADGVSMDIKVNVIDIAAPMATAVSVVLDKKTDIVPSLFVKDIKDASKVTLTFLNEPDKINKGIQNVTIKLSDEAGNYSYVKSTLNIMYDAIAPELSGISDVSTYIRKKPEYLLGVKALDDTDGEIQVTVDDSKVNYEVAGDYEVIYKATDKSKNVTTQAAKVTVMAVTREFVDSMADEIIAKNITESMSTSEKAWALFEYIQNNVRYINQADQSSIEKAAYDGLTLGVGDCYTFSALIEVFMQRIGAQTIFVSRSTGGNHYWQLCNFGTGWYHMDATPRKSTFKCFMKTDAEVNAESARYWVYDKSLYPEVSTTVYK